MHDAYLGIRADRAWIVIQHQRLNRRKRANGEHIVRLALCERHVGIDRNEPRIVCGGYLDVVVIRGNGYETGNLRKQEVFDERRHKIVIDDNVDGRGIGRSVERTQPGRIVDVLNLSCACASEKRETYGRCPCGRVWNGSYEQVVTVIQGNRTGIVDDRRRVACQCYANLVIARGHLSRANRLGKRE